MFSDNVTKDFVNRNGEVVKLQIVLLPASKGIPLMTKLSGVLGGLFSSGIESIPAALAEISDKIDFFDVAKTLFAGALISSQDPSTADFPLNPDKYFSGNYGMMIDFVAFALEANFGSFFDSKTLATKIPQ